MAKKTRDQRVEARRKRIEDRGFKRAAAKEVRKEERTERLAARKGITTEQAGRLQANRKQRFKEFAAGGTENITTGRLRFGSGDGGAAGSTATGGGTASDDSATQGRAAQAFSGAAQAASDRLGMGQDEMTGRGGRVYNPNRVASVEVGQHQMGGEGYSKRELGASGYSGYTNLGSALNEGFKKGQEDS